MEEDEGVREGENEEMGGGGGMTPEDEGVREGGNEEMGGRKDAGRTRE